MANSDGQRNVRAKAEVLSAYVVNQTATDAVVRIRARQTIQCCDNPGAPFINAGKAIDCQATLTYYKANRDWFLGKVEM